MGVCTNGNRNIRKSSNNRIITVPGESDPKLTEESKPKLPEESEPKIPEESEQKLPEESKLNFHLSGIIIGSKKIKKDSENDEKNDDQSIINRNDNSNPELNKSKNNQSNIQENEDDLSKVFINGKEITKKGDEPDEKDKSNEINYKIMNSVENQSEKKDSIDNNNDEIFQANAGNGISLINGKKPDDQNTNSKTEILNTNYENIDIKKDNYLICPFCELFITNVESVEYNSDIGDFNVKYKCFCNEKKENYLHSIIKDEMPICNKHNDKRIKFICQDCFTQFCEDCKNDIHKEHEVKNIINYEVIPDSIMIAISEKKDEFKGFYIFEKIFNSYKNSPFITKMPDDNSEKEENNSNGSILKGENKDIKEMNPEFEKQDEEKLSKEDKSSNKLSEKKEYNMNQIDLENGSQKKSEIIDDIKKDLEKEKKPEEEINMDLINEEPNPKNISIKSDNKDGNKINNDSNNNRSENNINKNLNNDAGNENEKNVNGENNLKKIDSIGLKSNIDNQKLNDENPDIGIPNGNNLQENERIENKITNSIHEKEPEIINIESQIKELNPSKQILIDGKKDENNNNIKINPEKSGNQEIKSSVNSEFNNNKNDNPNNGVNLIKSKNSVIRNLDNSINKLINSEKNMNPVKDINKDENNNMNNIEEKAESNNSNKKILKNFSNTKTFLGHEDRIVSLIRLTNGYIATGSYDRSIKIWDITKDPKEALLATKYSVGYIFCLLQLTPNELLAGHSENCIDIFDLNEDKIDPEKHLSGHTLWVTALVKCDEEHFASASNDTKIIIWDSNEKINLKELKGHEDCILTMIILENGNLCTGSADKTIRIWDWKKGECISYFKAHKNWVKTIYQFNSQTLLSGSDDRTIKMWNTNLEIICTLEGHKHSIRAFCKIDDNYFASGSFDSKIKIWDFNEKKCVNTLEEHSSNIICIIKYDDKLISCSNDKTIKIWEEI